MTDKINMCNSTGMASVCEQRESPNKQEEGCTYYEKASRSNRCMYLKYDEYCDCLEAQLDRKSFSKDKIAKFLEENQKRIDEEKALEEQESQLEGVKK